MDYKNICWVLRKKVELVTSIAISQTLWRFQVLLISITWILSGCSSDGPIANLDIKWKELASINKQLPENIRVLYGENSGVPVAVWALTYHPDTARFDLDIVVSTDDDRRETPSQFAERLGACVVVNGGYFLMQENPTSHVGLLQIDGQQVEAAIQSVIRRGKRYYTARGAFGIRRDQSFDIAWVSGQEGNLYAWDEPTPNSPLRRSMALDFTHAVVWDVEDALHAGPVLIHKGKIRIPVDEEVFFGTTIPDVHPRTAVGYRADGTLVLLIVDGRQVASRGVYLEELAAMMLELGCIEAINLDGGGSSTLVVNGTLLNRPEGNTSQREIMSAIVLTCHDDTTANHPMKN